MKKKNDNILSDIEKDIFGDWEKIQKKIRDEETEKRVMNNELNPQRINCPDFKQFYVRLLRILQSWDGRQEIDTILLLDLHDILRMIFSGIDNWSNPIPESFCKVWEMFCSPRHYKCDRGISCEKCMNTYDVFHRPISIEYQGYNFDGLDHAHHIERTVTRLSCPNCGYPLRDYVNGKVFGIFLHDKEKKLKNDIKGEFKNYF